MEQSLTPMPPSKIIGFHQDEEHVWVAELECGHAQHIRHQPPWQNAAWVLVKESRQGRLGTTLPCPLCQMPKLPENLCEYKRTPEFDATTVPRKLLQNHTLKPETWGEIVVIEGRALYTLEGGEELSFMLSPTVRGTVEPERLHRVDPKEGARFYVRFLRQG